jgi:hypothetical protein
LLPFDSPSISTARNSADLDLNSIKSTVFDLNDTSKVDECYARLTSVIGPEKLLLVCAKRSTSQDEGSNAEKLIKQVVVTLAFRKLHLLLSDLVGMPENCFDLVARRPVYEVVKAYVGGGVDKRFFTAVNECKASLSQYGSDLLAFSSIRSGSDLKQLSTLVEYAEKRADVAVSASSADAKTVVGEKGPARTFSTHQRL